MKQSILVLAALASLAPACAQTGNAYYWIERLAGRRVESTIGDGDLATAAVLASPQALAMDAENNLYIGEPYRRWV